MNIIPILLTAFLVLFSLRIAVSAETLQSILHLQTETLLEEESISEDGTTIANLSLATGKEKSADRLFYRITWANKTTKTLKNPEIIVTIPENQEFLLGTMVGEKCLCYFSMDQGKSFHNCQKIYSHNGGKSFSQTPGSMEQQNSPNYLVAWGEKYTTLKWKFRGEITPEQTGKVFFRTMIR
jgi:hypothetical protein